MVNEPEIGSGKALWARALDVARSILQGRAEAKDALSWRTLLVCALVCGLSYGAVMGSFELSPSRWTQVVFSSIKVPLLILGAYVLSLPSFYVLNALLGVHRDFPDAHRALMWTQAGLTIILVSLAPLTLFWYASFRSYDSAITFNGLMFALASLSAQILLRKHYRRLIAQNPRHRPLLACWMVIYVFVAIQLAWTLRPFVGDPRSPAEFFRRDVFSDNAYLVVAGLAWRFVTGR